VAAITVSIVGMTHVPFMSEECCGSTACYRADHSGGFGFGIIAVRAMTFDCACLAGIDASAQDTS